MTRPKRTVIRIMSDQHIGSKRSTDVLRQDLVDLKVAIKSGVKVEFMADGLHEIPREDLMTVTWKTRVGQVFFLFELLWKEALITQRPILSVLAQRIRSIFCWHVKDQSAPGMFPSHWRCVKCKEEFGRGHELVGGANE